MQFQLDHDGAQSLAEQICKSIKARILAGTYGPGERLPSTRQLAEIGVSQHGFRHSTC